MGPAEDLMEGEEVYVTRLDGKRFKIMVGKVIERNNGQARARFATL